MSSILNYINCFNVNIFHKLPLEVRIGVNLLQETIQLKLHIIWFNQKEALA